MGWEVVMPKLGMMMKAGKILSVAKKEGEKVQKGEILFTVETDKVEFEIEVPSSGIVGKIWVGVGDEVPIGTVIAIITGEGESIPAAAPKLEQSPEFSGEREGEERIFEKDLKVSPLARKLAAQVHIDVNQIKGTGPGGRIKKEDILRAAEERDAKKAPVPASMVPSGGVPGLPQVERVIKLSGIRQTIAQRLTQSFQNVPHAYLIVEADVTALEGLRNEVVGKSEKQYGIRVTFSDFFVKIVGKVLEGFPEINASWTDEGIKVWKNINIGLAVATPKGLIVPVIRDANQKSLLEIAKERSDLTTRGKEGKIQIDELFGSTLTITNLGAYEVDQFIAIINPPESAILALGTIRQKPCVVDQRIEIRSRMNLTLSFDHRTMDGAYAASFLKELKRNVETPGVIFIAS